MNICIRRARPEEADALTEIACRAKAHWGYPAHYVARWRDEFLTISPDYIVAHLVWVVVVEGDEPVAFAALERRATGDELEHLWVLPAYMGQGIGKRLFHVVARHSPEFSFTSDPHADGFYCKLGALKTGQRRSAYQGIILTEFRYRRAQANESAFASPKSS